MQDNKFEKEIFEKIEEKKIRPRPKWEFSLRNYIMWLFGFLSLAIGSLAVSVIIYMLLHNDWEVYEKINDNLLEFILVTLPYFWIVMLALFIIAADYNLKHTKGGYKYNLILVIIASVGVNIVLGAILYNAGAGQAIDDILGKNAPFYKEIINRRVNLWAHPEEGRLMGRIMQVEPGDDLLFIIKDFRQGDWLVDAEKSEIMPMVKVEVGEDIKIIGEPLENYKFIAHIIMPIGPGRGFFKRAPMMENCFQGDSLPCPQMIHK